MKETANKAIPMVEEGIVKEFFNELENDCDKRRGVLGKKIEQLVKTHPALLEATYDHPEYGLVTATEFLCCHQLSTSSRDLLYELIQLGAKATTKCYKESLHFYNFVECLLITGYMPIDLEGGEKFLDQMMDHHSYFKDDVETQEDILRLLLGLAEVGDQFCFGELTEANLKRLKQLPDLEPGVTHKQGGQFDDILQDYLSTLEVDESKRIKKKHKSVHEEEEIKSIEMHVAQ